MGVAIMDLFEMGPGTMREGHGTMSDPGSWRVSWLVLCLESLQISLGIDGGGRDPTTARFV